MAFAFRPCVPAAAGAGWALASTVRSCIVPRSPRSRLLCRRVAGRLLFLFRAGGALVRLGGIGGRSKPRLQQGGSRLGQARGAIAHRAFLDVAPAGFVPLARKAVLVADESGGVLIVLGAVLERVQSLAHRLLGQRASLGDRCSVLPDPGRVRPP